MLVPAAILSDMDGTLVDSYEANFRAYSAAVSEFGLFLPEHDFRRAWGRDSRDFLPSLFPHLDDTCVGQIRELKAKYFLEFVSFTRLNIPLIALLANQRSDTRVGLVTTAKRPNVEAVIGFHGLKSLFDCIVAGDEVQRSKPNPEAYLLALRKLDCRPIDVVAIEDSSSGIAAARSAGIVCLRVSVDDVI